MIVPVPNERYSPHYVDGYVLLLRQIQTPEAFLTAAGVTGEGYAATLMRTIYRQLYVKSLDFKHEFDTYYKPEYRSFSEYLERNYSVPDELLEKADQYYEEYAHILLAHPYASFLHNEEGEKRLKALLEEPD